MSVSVAGVAVTLGNSQILHGVDINVESGAFHALVGPNGSGKSTLLRCVYRSLRPAAGAVMLNGEDLWSTMSARSASKVRAVLTQDSDFDLEFCVHDVVMMGRIPHKGLFDRDTTRDHDLVDDALETVGMAWAASRLVSTLSGGERQRVLLARALAQQASILVLDEPTNHLDIRAQLELLDVITSLELTTIAALHDLDHAASLCTGVTVLHRGAVVASGAPLDVLTVERIRQVFGVDAHVGQHPLTGRPHVTFASL